MQQTPFKFIDTVEDLNEMCSDLSVAQEIAVDLEV